MAFLLGRVFGKKKRIRKTGFMKQGGPAAGLVAKPGRSRRKRRPF